MNAISRWRGRAPPHEPHTQIACRGQLLQNSANFRLPPVRVRIDNGAVVITYEYPLNERIRTLLRLEDLFERSGHFIRQPGPQDHHVALLTLFEIMEVAGRADLKSDLLQELERQKQVLRAFATIRTFRKTRSTRCSATWSRPRRRCSA